MKLLLYLLLIIFLLSVSTPVLAVNVKINEFVAHPSSGNQEWVEFYNPENTDISTYWLDDDTDFANDDGNSNKKSLSTINTGNLIYPYLEFGSFLNNDSDYVVLFGADGSIVDQYQYTSDPGSDITIGRSPDGSGQFTPLSSQTKGSANSNPVPTPTPTPNPTPTPSPSPSPTPSPTPTPTPANSPTPTPIKSPSPSPSPKPTPKSSPSPSSQTSTVLGETSETNSSPSPSASPETESGSLSKTKAAALITGAGAILIALSFGFYLWYSKLLGQEKAEDIIEVEEVPESLS